jgi:glycosyltransferase involved in cell wall biosynthesis
LTRPAPRPVLPYEDVLRLSREGEAPLSEPMPGMSERQRLHLAVVVPPFSLGSGGHGTIFQLIRRLEDMGHTCSIWLHDPAEMLGARSPAAVRRLIREWYAPVSAPVFKEFEEWYGADVAIATGWSTVYASLLLDRCRCRAYLINDHEPDFYPASAEAIWAADTYSLGLYGISASRWLRDLLAARYGQEGTWFRLAVDHSLYHRYPVGRETDLVTLYARTWTPRRAVALGLLALQELHARRPEVRLSLFGHDGELDPGFPHEELGVLPPDALARHYAEATVGVSLSLTNYSSIPQEMMACGLPSVDVGGGSAEAEFGADGAMEFADPDPLSIADAVERLLTDETLWRRRSDAGIEHVRSATWENAALQVERGLREALAARERASVV